MFTFISCANHEWIEALQGRMGRNAQQHAYDELARHLSTVIHFYLLRRQPDLLWLSTLASQEIASLTQDLVQVCLMKLSKDDHAKLRQYSGTGTFKGWISQVALNAARSELRKVRWDRRLPLDSIKFLSLDRTPTPEAALQQEQLCSVLQHCLAELPENHRIVLVRCVMNGEPTQVVARDLRRTNQAVYNLINRAKKKLRALLVQEEIEAEDLTIFA